MITVGDRQVLLNHSFIIPVGEEAVFDTPPGQPGIKISIRFDDTPAELGQSSVTWAVVDNILRITFKGWTNTLGTSLRKPAKLGDLPNGWPFGFNVMHLFIGQVHFLTFELYVGGTY